jgi:hypothetical protein
MGRKMKKIILLGTFVFAGIILMSNSASAVEYRTAIENNTHMIISQETTVLEKFTKLIPTLKITLRHPIIRLIIRLITFIPRMFVRIACRILILILKIIQFPLKLITKSITILITLLRLIILLSHL